MRENIGPLEALRRAMAEALKELQDLRRDVAGIKAGQQALLSGQQTEQSALSALKLEEDKVMATVAEILADVQDESQVDDSIITLLGNIKQALDNAGTDPAALDQVKALIDANKAKIAAAVVANTPAAGLTSKPAGGPTG